jgi:hypothetical protein
MAQEQGFFQRNVQAGDQFFQEEGHMTTFAVTPGFSNEARFVENATQCSRRKLQGTNVFGIESALRDELATVWEECRQPNWDGYQALPINQDTLRSAYVFLESLPLGFSAPSIGAEPDGAITLEWHRSERRTLSVSVGSTDELHYAALLGPNRVYGAEAFFGEVPRSILDLIRKVYTA